MKLASHCLWLIAGVATLLIAVGCSRPAGRNVETGNLVITITNGDQPATGVTVRAIADSGESGGLGDLDSTGNVTIKNLDVGEYRIALFPSVEGDPSPEGTGASQPAPTKQVTIPKKLQDEAQTPLRATVTGRESTATFNLKDY